MIRVSEHIYLVDTIALGTKGTVASYLVRGDEGAALIDVGYASSLEHLLNGLRKIGIELEKINYVISTHLHLDHAGAVGQLTRLSPNIQVLSHPRAVKHLVNPSRLIASVREVYRGAEKAFGEVLPVPQERIKGAEDGERIELGGVTLRIIHAPGHAYHHVVVYVEEDRALAAGDAVSMKYPDFPVPVLTTPPPSYNYEEAVETLKKLLKLDGEIILKPHFGVFPWSENFFEEEITLLKRWRELIESVKEESEEEAFTKVLEEYGKMSGIEPQLFPLHVHRGLNISYKGMRLYLERLG